MNTIPKLLPLIAAALLLNACVPASSIKPVNSFADLGAGEVLIVGKVELNPPLGANEQVLGESYEEFRNAVILVTDNELREAGALGWGDLSTRIDAPFGEPFFASHKAEPFYLLKGWVVMNAKVEVMTPGESYAGGNAPLFGTFRVDAQPGDKAIYIGTIRYHRDDFFGTEKVEVKNEYTVARQAFRKRFGTGIPLRKALVIPVQ